MINDKNFQGDRLDPGDTECLIGMDAGGSFLKASLYRVNGERITGVFQHAAYSEGTKLEIAVAYRDFLKNLRREAEARGLTVQGVSVDFPGPFDYQNGISLMEHKYRALYGIPLRPWFRDVLGGDVKVHFVHDSAAFLGGCMLYGGMGNLAGVMLGTGLGFALGVEGRVLRKPNGSPLVSIYNAPYRGKTAEDYISARGILNAYNSRALTPAPNVRAIGDAADAGDARAIAFWNEIGAMLAEIISPVLSDYRVEALYLGGQISRSLPVFYETLRQGLSGVSTLKTIERPKNAETVHTDGAIHFYRKEVLLQ